MALKLGDEVHTIFDKRPATILAVVQDPSTGKVDKHREAGIHALQNVPVDEVELNDFEHDDGTLVQEPVYFLQGVDWWGWFIESELLYVDPQPRLL